MTTIPQICSKSKCKNPLPAASPDGKCFKTCDRCRNRDKISLATLRKRKREGEDPVAHPAPANRIYENPSREQGGPSMVEPGIMATNAVDPDSGSEKESEHVSLLLMISRNMLKSYSYIHMFHTRAANLCSIHFVAISGMERMLLFSATTSFLMIHWSMTKSGSR